jgi:DivIVA domain-containing protein
MDRDEIERRDFPVGRKGYDPGAVDAHLRAVADEIDGLRAGAAPAPPRGIAAGASEQVRVILEAAERSATELRDQAAKEAGDHVARVEIAADRMLGRLGGLQNELDALLEALKRSGALLETGLKELREDVSATSGAVRVPDEARAPDEDGLEPPLPGLVPEPPVVGPPAAAPGEPPVVGPPVAAPNGDEAGARLIALNMALGGTPREETARYLAEHYSLADPEALLDDVYSRASGA